ncbi:50S ribosomal protein L21e [Candidatus Nanohaloarchaea archaeon]|nr:50S ribosomal protein L21e [Candidatus Nanohaloarchaea archaeon]
MAEKSRGALHGSRKKFKREQGAKTKVNEYLKEFEEGEQALIKIDSSVQEGQPHARFHGTTVKVTGERGDAYEVKFNDGGQEKTLYVAPVHLQKLNEEE